MYHKNCFYLSIFLWNRIWIYPSKIGFPKKLEETKTVWVPCLNVVQTGLGFWVDGRFSENQNRTGIISLVVIQIKNFLLQHHVPWSIGFRRLYLRYWKKLWFSANFHILNIVMRFNHSVPLHFAENVQSTAS